MKLSEMIKTLIEAPEDLTSLPAILEQAQTLEASNDEQIATIGTLQENYHKAIKMIPVKELEDDTEAEEEKTEAPTIEKAVENILEDMKNW